MQGHRQYTEPRPVIKRQANPALVRQIRHIRETGFLDRIKSERVNDGY